MKPSCTLITAIKPTTVTKGFSLKTDGTLDKKTTCHVTAGNMEIIDFDNLAEFAKILTSLRKNQCLTYGIPPHSPIELVTEEAWRNACYADSQISRTNKTMRWPAGPGILMLDYDAPKDGKPALSQEELLGALFEAYPILGFHDILWWPSTSSCIYHGNQELSGIRGQRLYILVCDASEIPRAGQAILTKLWAKGYGHYEVSKSGSLLERGLFDASVWQPSRIDFAAGAKCHGELEQKRGDPVLHAGAFSGPVDSVDIFTAPTQEEIALAEKNKADQKALVYEEAKRIRENWKHEQIEELARQNRNVPRDQLETIISRAVETHELMGDWIITVIDNDTEKKVCVSQILDDAPYYHGMLTLDPLEPDYDGSRIVGKLFLNGARPVLNSFAHGGRKYKLCRMLDRIEIVRGKEREATDALLEFLRKAPGIFDFGAELVMIGNNGELVPQNEHSLRYLVGGLVQFWRWHKLPPKDPVEVLEDPPAGVCKAILALGSNRRLKPLDAVISAPTLRHDGSVLDIAGYDEKTQLFFNTDDHIELIPENPTRKEALSALKTVWNVFETFPFVSSIDRAVHLAAILTAVVRPVLPTAPAFAYDAPIQGSGKTLLARCIGALATGSDPDIWPHTSSRDDEETRKRIMTALRMGARAIVWDNVVGTFDSAAMASFLTSDRYRDRLLGKSESSSITNRTLLLITGNNLTLTGDMSRRVLIARIDPKTDKPFARSFGIDPLAVCIAERQKMIAAALILIRYYLRSGVERPGEGRMASFEQWDDWVRQSVIHIGVELAPGEFGDVMEQIQANQASDPEQEILGNLLLALRLNFDNNIFSAADVLKKAKYNMSVVEDDLISPEMQLSEAIDAFKTSRTELNSKSLGRIFSYRKDRIIDGLFLEKAGDLKGTSQWRVRCCVAMKS